MLKLWPPENNALDQPLRKEKQFWNRAITIENEKCRISLNKLIYVGTCILDLIKILMQHYIKINIMIKLKCC